MYAGWKAVALPGGSGDRDFYTGLADRIAAAGPVFLFEYVEEP
jgi:hypothetical protein